METTADHALASRYGEAMQAFQASRFEAARHLLEQCQAEDPSHVGVRAGLAACYARTGAAAAAERLFREIVTERPELAHIRGELGLLLAAQGRTAEAKEELGAALAADPGNHVVGRKLAQLEPASNGSGPTRSPSVASALVIPRNSLAANLDDEEATADPHVAGKIICRGKRSLWSHRRLWIGAALLLYLPLALLARRRLEEAVAALPSGPDLAGTAPSLDLGQMLLGLFIILLQIFGYSLLIISLVLIIGGLVSSQLSTYVVRERRVEITRGVLWRSQRYVWLYDITDLELVRDPILLLTGTAKIKIKVEDLNATPVSLKKSPTIIGFGNHAFMRKLFERLQPMVLTERRAMKKAFI